MPVFTTVMLLRLLAILTLAIPISALAQPPNIVVIMSDDQPDVETLSTLPILRREMVLKGVTFKNSFVDFSLCCPSRSSFLTGLGAHNHHVLNNTADLDGGYFKFFSQGWEDHTIALWLKQVGYRTALIGKYLNQYPMKAGVTFTHVPPGWDEWQAFVRGALYYNYDLNENGRIVHYGSDDAAYSTDVLTAKAVRFIRSQASSSAPFFLLLTPNAPHTGVETINGLPVPTPASRDRGKFSNWPLPKWPSFNEADVSDKPTFVQEVPLLDAQAIEDVTARYRLMRETLLAVDQMLNHVLRALELAGKLDNTIVVFTSDNGMLYGQHRLLEKEWLYEQSIRVPLFIRGPSVPKAEVRPQIVNNLDVVSTIVAAARATPDHVIDGRNLLPIIRNPSAPWRTALLVQGNDLDSNGNFNPYFAVRTARYIYGKHQTVQWGAEFEIYDLLTDPDQLTNVAGEPRYQRLLTQFKSILATLKTCSGETCWYAKAITPQNIQSGSSRHGAPIHHDSLSNMFLTRRSYDLWQAARNAREIGP